MSARLKDMYKNEVAPALMKKYNYSSPMQIPRFEKIVINVGTGDAKDNSKVIENVILRRLPDNAQFRLWLKNRLQTLSFVRV